MSLGDAHLLPYSIPMAYLHRVGKPVQDWNQEDLLAYNIHVHPQPQSVFFNGLRCSGGALPSVSPTSPLNPFLTTPINTPNSDIGRLTSTLLSSLYFPSPVGFELDGKVDNFAACLIASMGPPYSSEDSINPGPTITLNNCGKKYPTYADADLPQLPHIIHDQSPSHARTLHWNERAF